MALRLENVGRNYQSQWALRNVSATINAGTSVAVLGPNGAGKTTLLRLIAGWLPAAEGRISIEDFTLRPSNESVRRRLMLLDEPLANMASVIESIGQAIDDYGADREGIEAEVAEWFERLDLVGVYGKASRAVSRGQRYKVALISLFLIRPFIWLLDEPHSAGLDAGGLKILESEMRSHVDAGGIVIFSSQWPQHANRLADESLVLHQGELVCQQSSAGQVSPALLQSAAPALSAVLTGLGGD